MVKFLLSLMIGLIFSFQLVSQSRKFVKVEDNGFYCKGKPYKYLGANFWQGMYLGMPGEAGDRELLKKELDHMQSLGITNLRILGSSEGNGKYQITPTLLTAPGEYNQTVFEGLDFLLDEMRKRKMKAVVVLNNFWMWSGGMPQYVSWSNNEEVVLPNIEGGGSWNDFINYSLRFFEDSSAQAIFSNHLTVLINRKNSVNGRKYKKDPTIMAWQLCNEPRGYHNPTAYRKWISSTAAFIQGIDESHMVCLGAEGDTGTEYSGVDLYEDNLSDHLDYATTHLWIQNWSWFDPQDTASFTQALEKSKEYLTKQIEKANMLNKPLVVEEFGVSRDLGNFESRSAISYRDEYYQFIFNFVLNQVSNNGIIQGCNFWSWSGRSVPANPGGMWSSNDPLTGDPPHEKQGWYSVYSHDESTLEIIEQYSNAINEFNNNRNR
ncbi:MAG: cellulase family glycosylhydrolase [bacterium]|nr:cellulase family glycosylhydrolase [bacterium]